MAGKKDNTITFKSCDAFKAFLANLALELGVDAATVIRTSIILSEGQLRSNPWLLESVEDRFNDRQ